MRKDFLLEPETIFLNHGSFGATPRVVFEAYQQYQRQLETQPVRFFQREAQPALAKAREALGAYLGVDGQDLVFVHNATFGVNAIARSLALGPGDEVLTSDQEYGACNNTWQFLSKKQGFSYVHQSLSFPASSREAIVERVLAGVNEKTKVIFLSHITSPTAFIFPIEEICARARAHHILTIIDGAHVPGQLDLNLHDLAADVYTGNCHKWLCSPKSAAFLYIHPDKQHLIEPLVVSWGRSVLPQDSLGSQFLDDYSWLGTEDIAAYLSVVDAIHFQKSHNWPLLRQACHERLKLSLNHINALTGLPSYYPDDSFYAQMAIAALPKGTNLAKLKEKLYHDYHIEIPLTEHRGQGFVRISVQVYTSAEDLMALVKALKQELLFAQ
ncbi:MAG: aminotransferase class V-fold PLP-dependent enzyme [Deinococcales bacterium]